ncbi:oxygen-dependent protoporphyrinogen oxidase [Propionibacterium cyclohexanicum]|uniref:Coproporphyrinogen III oxidase n=1 Tax=Propionibacterium cyclohexanicum TaxID=64702 RepID=A0A1H9SWJ4_9ACTN|nr:protoporphyrinogen oxidase [Propionibacterium cyclohexanicum]SER88759.1 oxygen-dependent protoporphyrinogen oxidase [Propionibacterium cyclohexanicum]
MDTVTTQPSRHSTPPADQDLHLVVVGGGITGLAAAWQGVRRGARVSLFEAGPRLGGKLHTVHRDGFVVEAGPDSFVRYRPAALQLIDELGLSGEVIGAGGGRRVSLLSRGKLRPMPAGMGMVLPTRMWPFVTTSVLSWPDKLRAGLDLFIPRQLGEGDIAIGDFLRKRLGDGIVRRFADPMVGGIYGAGVDELSLDAVLPSLRASEQEYRSLMVASLAQGRERRRKAAGATSTGGPSASMFATVRGGLGQLVDALDRALRAAGAQIRTGVAVSGLDDQGIALDNGERVDADAVILAGGVASSRLLLSRTVPGAAQALAEVPLASTTIVSLGWKSSDFDTVPESQGWLEADEGSFSGLTVSSVKFAGRAPEDSVLVRVFVPDKRGPLCAAPDDELVAATLVHVGPLLGVRARPRLVEISRWPGLMPKYTVGHLGRAATVDAALRDGHPHWAVAGSALHGVGIPDCIADARSRTDAVLDAARDAHRGGTGPRTRVEQAGR